MIWAAVWLCCGASAAQIQRRYWRQRGSTDNVAWYGYLALLLLGPIALAGCLIAYRK